MARQQGEIRINYTNREINGMLSARASGPSTITRHYSQNEEFFVKIGDDFFVPSFPIHHDVTRQEPTKRYLEILKIFLSGVVPLVPQVFTGLTYFFDPTDILRPGFFQLYRLGDIHYLYMLKIDLAYKPHDHDIARQGTNDTTAEYRSRKLFLDATVIPLDSVERLDDKIEGFKVKQTVSQTWIGETGRGYMMQGIWIDHDLTKFFTRLFVPPQKRVYPYFPFQCRYKTICQEIIDLDPDGRKKNAPYLHRALAFVTPVMKIIENALRTGEFSEDLPAFKALKKRIPGIWDNIWDEIHINAYLNEHDMREYVVANEG